MRGVEGDVLEERLSRVLRGVVAQAFNRVIGCRRGQVMAGLVGLLLDRQVVADGSPSREVIARIVDDQRVVETGGQGFAVSTGKVVSVSCGKS